MARKVVVTLVDDYDGTSQAEETVRFAVDGVAYEIDLSVANANELRAVFEPWATHARKVGRRPQGKAGVTRPARDGEQSALIRQWAKKNGHKVSERGRISADIAAAYAEASK